MGSVDGVDIPAHGRLAGLLTLLLADQAVVGVDGQDALADASLDGLVGLGHEGPVGLGGDLEVAPEVGQGEGVGLVAERQREVQPAAQLGLRPEPQRGAPFGTVGGTHERIRSPAGSHSGSRTTSAPTQAPKTSISPRVPGTARSGGR